MGSFFRRLPVEIKNYKMKTIHEIEQELAEAKHLQNAKYLQDKFIALKEKYEGKAFGTHTFERRNKSAYASVNYYEKFWIKDNSIMFLRWSISIQRCGKNYEFSQDQLSFSRIKSEMNSDNITSGSYGEKKIVSYSKFMQLWEYGEFATTKLNDLFTTITDIYPTDLLRVGSSNDERMLETAFNSLRLDFVDITKDYRVFNALQYKHLPFLQEQKYLPKVHAKEILNYQISLWECEKRQRYCNHTDRINRDIETIRNFIATKL